LDGNEARKAKKALDDLEENGKENRKVRPER